MHETINHYIPKELEKKLHFYKVLMDILFYFFMAYLVGGILLSLFVGISLTLDYTTLNRIILYGFIFVGLLIQGRRYVLYKKADNATEFLKKRGMIFGIIVILFILVYFFVDPYMPLF